MQSLFIDESGYSGPDLLNEDQPVFALAAIGIEENLAKSLKVKYFPEYGDEELKHSKLYSDESQANKLIGLIQECLETQYVRAYIIEKRFLACEMFVLDIIARFRPNVQYGTQLFRDFAWLLRSPPKEWMFMDEVNLLLHQYVGTVSKLLRMKDASKEKIIRVYRPFYDVLCGLQNALLRQMCFHARVMDASFAFDLQHSPLSGCAQSGLFGLITCFEKDILDDYEIVFDKSPSLIEFQPTIGNLKSCAADKVRVSKEVTLELPLKRLIGMREVDSKKSVGTQLADLIAGSVVRSGIQDFGLQLKKKYDGYDTLVRELWARHAMSRLYKPTFDNNYIDTSKDAARIIRAASGK